MLARSIKTISFKVSSRYLSHSSLIANFLNRSINININIIPILFYLTHLQVASPICYICFHPPTLLFVGNPGVSGDRDLHPPQLVVVLVLGSPGLSPLKRYQVTSRDWKFLTWKFSPGKNGEKLKRRHVCSCLGGGGKNSSTGVFFCMIFCFQPSKNMEWMVFWKKRILFKQTYLWYRSSVWIRWSHKGHPHMGNTGCEECHIIQQQIPSTPHLSSSWRFIYPQRAEDLQQVTS